MLKGSQAGTGLNALLRQLPKAADDIGFEIVRDEDGVLDTIATLENLKDATAFITDPDEKAMLLQKALIPLLSNLDDLKKNFAEVRDKTTGTFDEGYQRRINSASGQWGIFTQNLSNVGTTLANTLLPAISFVLTPIAKMMGWVGTMIEKFPVVGYVLGGLVTGFILSAVAVGTYTAAQWLWNAAFVASPIGLVVAGIALVVGGAYLLYKNWSKVTDWFHEQLSAIGDKFSWIGDLWSSVFGGGDEEK